MGVGTLTPLGAKMAKDAIDEFLDAMHRFNQYRRSLDAGVDVIPKGVTKDQAYAIKYQWEVERGIREPQRPIERQPAENEQLGLFDKPI